MSRRIHFRSALAGGIVAAVVVTALPAIAAQVGDAFKLGEVNSVQARSSLVGSVASQNLRVFNNHPNGEALFLSVEPGNAPLVVDSNKRVPKLNADLLDNRHASQLIRAAFDSTGNAPDANGDAASTTITAPKPGILIMAGSVDATDGGERDLYICRLKVNDALVPNSQRDSMVDFAGSSHVSNESENCSTDAAMVVDKGTHTVSFHITNWNSVLLTEASVWVIWVPFDGNGQIPTP